MHLLYSDDFQRHFAGNLPGGKCGCPSTRAHWDRTAGKEALLAGRVSGWRHLGSAVGPLESSSYERRPPMTTGIGADVRPDTSNWERYGRQMPSFPHLKVGKRENLVFHK